MTNIQTDAKFDSEFPFRNLSDEVILDSFDESSLVLDTNRVSLKEISKNYLEPNVFDFESGDWE